jgi:hypothetical protein
MKQYRRQNEQRRVGSGTCNGDPQSGDHDCVDLDVDALGEINRILGRCNLPKLSRDDAGKTIVDILGPGFSTSEKGGE